ncbi:helix-turn-helix transcriptional regulator [Paraburkholderia terricola]|uniref:DNA-binding CsgD family transcriptional regulator n=1 Tax=Paraburkholderia terricola TaxID=169427 RepID=A0ABU1LRJ9_9BURK|nr:autoinducer binding domain-containing protein [Paraburkholderia terricola]MDR6409151.1 DNA-binding CsgD family transcriptional regulator [Paraburkholderia terricola]MDR6482586.1 DNA-binding CsgD family transcriptional regulator [Paraburkholderia terricola]
MVRSGKAHAWVESPPQASRFKRARSARATDADADLPPASREDGNACLDSPGACLADTRLALDLAGAGHPQERLRMASAMWNVIGFTSFANGFVQFEGDAAARWSSKWVDVPAHPGSAYFRAGYHLHDPRLRAALRHNAPLVWDSRWLAQAWSRNGSPTALHGLFDELAREQVGSGVIFAFTTGARDVRAIVSLGAGRSRSDWISDVVLAQALTIGLSLHRARPGDPAALSDTEARILMGVVSGLGNREIALRLRTSEQRVDYHLRALRRKYRATTRAELAFIAGSMGLR